MAFYFIMNAIFGIINIFIVIVFVFIDLLLLYLFFKSKGVYGAT